MKIRETFGEVLKTGFICKNICLYEVGKLRRLRFQTSIKLFTMSKLRKQREIYFCISTKFNSIYASKDLGRG